MSAAIKLSTIFHLLLFPFIETLLRQNFDIDKSENVPNTGAKLLELIENRVDVDVFNTLHAIRKSSNEYKHDISIKTKNINKALIIRDLRAVNELIQALFENPKYQGLVFEVSEIEAQIDEYSENKSSIDTKLKEIDVPNEKELGDKSHVKKTIALQSEIKTAEDKNSAMAHGNHDNLNPKKTSESRPVSATNNAGGSLSLEEFAIRLQSESDKYYFAVRVQKTPSGDDLTYVKLTNLVSKSIIKNNYSGIFSVVYNFITRSFYVNRDHASSFVRSRDVNNYAVFNISVDMVYRCQSEKVS